MKISRTTNPQKPNFPVREHWVVGKEHFGSTDEFLGAVDRLDGADAYYAFSLKEKEHFSVGDRLLHTATGGAAGAAFGAIGGAIAGVASGVMGHILDSIFFVMINLTNGPPPTPTPLAASLPFIVGGLAVGGAVGAAFGLFSQPAQPDTFVTKATIKLEDGSPVFHQESNNDRPIDLESLVSASHLLSIAEDKQRQEELRAELRTHIREDRPLRGRGV